MRHDTARAGVGSDDLVRICREVERILSFVLRFTTVRQTPLVLGALYLMRSGVEYELLRVPAIPLLREQLPRLPELARYGWKRSAVRVGQNTIERQARTWNDPNLGAHNAARSDCE